MISIKNSSIGRTEGPPQIPSRDPTRLLTSRSAPALSTRTVVSRTEPCPHGCFAGSARSQTVPPAGCELSFTSRRKIQQPSGVVLGAAVKPHSRGLIRPLETKRSASGEETRKQCTGSRDVQNRPASKAVQRQQPDTSSPESDFRTAPNAVSATERLNNPLRKATTSSKSLTRPLYKSRDSEFRLMKIGLETEFYLAARNPINDRGNLPEFVTVLARNYNKQISVRHPRMLETMRAYRYTGPYDKWCLLRDESLGSNWLPCKRLLSKQHQSLC
jgi:hypothetical protein